MAVRLQEIADYCGVSIPAVSQALNSTGQLRAETRHRVLKAASKLGYRPNSSARAIRSGQFGTIALLASINFDYGGLYPRFLAGVQAALTEPNLHLSIAQLPDQKLTDETWVPKILRELLVDGLLINYFSHIPDRLIRLICDYDIPSVWIHSRHKADCVHANDFEAGRRLTEHLLRLGHRRVAFINYGPSHTRTEDAYHSAVDRYTGYVKAMHEAGLRPLPTVGGQFVQRDQRVAYSAQWLSHCDRPSAVVTSSFTEAMPVYFAATSLHGLRVPEELSIATVDDRLVDVLGVPITRMVMPEYELGRVAVEMLLRKIDSPSHRLPPKMIDYSFSEGQTCGPPPQGEPQKPMNT